MYFDTKIVSVSSGKVLTVPGPTKGTAQIPAKIYAKPATKRWGACTQDGTLEARTSVIVKNEFIL